MAVKIKMIENTDLKFKVVHMVNSLKYKHKKWIPVGVIPTPGFGMENPKLRRWSQEATGEFIAPPIKTIKFPLEPIQVPATDDDILQEGDLWEFGKKPGVGDLTEAVFDSGIFSTRREVKEMLEHIF